MGQVVKYDISICIQIDYPVSGYIAGAPGLEPETKILEILMIPLHHAPLLPYGNNHFYSITNPLGLPSYVVLNNFQPAITNKKPTLEFKHWLLGIGH